jgi:hypothetical protein
MILLMYADPFADQNEFQKIMGVPFHILDREIIIDKVAFPGIGEKMV